MATYLTAIKPSGELTLGNYIGCIKPLLDLQNSLTETDKLLVFIADLHAITKYIEPVRLQSNTLELIKTYLAAGLDASKTCIFQQSKVPAHTQLEWILTCATNLSELTKMPQYKNYLATNKNKATPTGMLMYPSLMNADILLYDTDIVPVGLDQMSHVDLCRDVAETFNKRYRNVFTIPKGKLALVGSKIMSLADPTKKMSKSESDGGTIYLTDTSQVARQKIMKAKTDSEGIVKYDPQNKPGISNLMTILACLTGVSFEDLETKYCDVTVPYKALKTDVADAVCSLLDNLQNKIASISDTYSKVILEIGTLAANTIANEKLKQVYDAVGFF